MSEVSGNEKLAARNPDREISYDPMACFKEFYSLDSTLYQLGHLVEHRDEREAHRIPVLSKTYSIPGVAAQHLCTLDIRMLRRLLRHPLLIAPISAALTECFWALLEWDIDPELASIHLYVSPSADEPYDKETVMRLQIPRRAPVNRTEFWAHIDSRVFARVPHSVLTTVVERVDIGPHSVSGFRKDLE